MCIALVYPITPAYYKNTFCHPKERSYDPMMAINYVYLIVMRMVGTCNTKARKMPMQTSRSHRPRVLHSRGHVPKVAVLLLRTSDKARKFMLARLSEIHVHSENTGSYCKYEDKIFWVWLVYRSCVSEEVGHDFCWVSNYHFALASNFQNRALESKEISDADI